MQGRRHQWSMANGDRHTYRDENGGHRGPPHCSAPRRDPVPDHPTTATPTHAHPAHPALPPSVPTSTPPHPDHISLYLCLSLTHTHTHTLSLYRYTMLSALPTWPFMPCSRNALMTYSGASSRYSSRWTSWGGGKGRREGKGEMGSG